ncbi:MAG TPA: hypothetical protein PKA48_05860 [Candidatus Obscuribacter sp.]|nr:hypothetical protein [Candidatus Obscuribacter sp.]
MNAIEQPIERIEKDKLFSSMKVYLRSISRLVPWALELSIKINDLDDQVKVAEADVLLKQAFWLIDRALDHVHISSDISGEPEDWMVDEWVQYIMSCDGEVDWEWLNQIELADISAGEALVKQVADLLGQASAIIGVVRANQMG